MLPDRSKAGCLRSNERLSHHKDSRDEALPPLSSSESEGVVPSAHTYSGDVADATRRSQGEEAAVMAAHRGWFVHGYELSYIQRNARPGLHV